ncbi:MAG: hypothetical protein GF330_09155 [Candidatus Eisenbacteria bacterium]|nr:hypothetical protein [Candidatus Eisenbacteria bacterium]
MGPSSGSAMMISPRRRLSCSACSSTPRICWRRRRCGASSPPSSKPHARGAQGGSHRMRTFSLLLCGCLAIAGWGCGEEAAMDPAGSPGRLIVKPDGSGTQRTIQAAIDLAAEGDTVHLASGTFVGAGNRDLDFRGKRLIVRSLAQQADSCIIDCQGSAASPHRGFRFHSSERSASKLIALTVRNGYAERGGAILCSSVSSPSFVDCIFRDNRAVESGGACHFGDNSSPALSGCRFDSNRAGEMGGAIYCGDGAPAITGCAFSTNSAAAGGGLQIETTPAAQWLALVSCTFYGQSPDAVACRDARLQLQRSILAFGTGGPAVSCDGSCELTVSCCDAYGNQGGDWVGCLAAWEGSGHNFSADPRFCDAPGGDLRLAADSPCLLAPDCGRVGAWPQGCGAGF